MRSRKKNTIEPIVQFPEFPGERWDIIPDRAINNIVPCYYISTYGRAFSCNRKYDIMNQSTVMEGYHTIAVRLKSGISRTYTVHRTMMLTFRYNEYLEFKKIHPEHEPQVNHIDGNKDHNYISNLEWCTPSYNIQHAFDIGLKHQHHGEDCSFATITNDQAKNVAKLLLSKQYTHKQISEMLNIPVHIVNAISEGTNWKDIYDEYGLESQKREPRPRMSDNDLNELCKYIQDNKSKYGDIQQVYIEGLKVLFNIDYTPSMVTTMKRILNHSTRRSIVDKYDF